MNLLFVALCLWVPAVAPADGVIDFAADASTDSLFTYFPNWRLAKAADFVVEICDDISCAPDTNCPITGLTLWNYGTASGGATGDITNVVFELLCGKADYWSTMTYAGIWTDSDAVSRPAWTWDGSLAWSKDPGADCAGFARISVFADVGACPTDGATVKLGVAFDDILDPFSPGGLWDACGFDVPYDGDVLRTGTEKVIRYALKTADRDLVAPGETVTYTIYYSRPGAAVTNFVITDSLPADTHYVAGSAAPAADVFWDPDPGPPSRLKWTIPGGPSAGGATASVSFSLTPDWGNGEGFEPGSGDQGAVEGSRVANSATIEFRGAGCTPSTVTSNLTDLPVRRYMMWMVSDQDILFAPRVGYPDDEVTYSIFMINPASKTWWNVSVWDTVPPQLDVWAQGYGFDDPCVGWTMTPTGCAAASPGRVTSGGATLLTWKLDMPPGFTLEMRWKARVNPTGALPGATAINRVNMLALGAPGTIGGSGHARAPRRFVHQAMVALRTTYFSYVGEASGQAGGGLVISFWPLNKSTVFELRKLYTEGAGFASVGGKSASIVDFAGACAGGFIDGGYGGCGVERAPAQYQWAASAPGGPNAALYKLTSNAPLLWMLMPGLGWYGDAGTYIPSSTLSFAGTVLYSYRRAQNTNGAAGVGESWVVINTGIDPDGGAFNPDQLTSVHIFSWDAAGLAWSYLKSADIAGNSLWMPFQGCPQGTENHYKIISSDCNLIVLQAYNVFSDIGDKYANEFLAISPTSQTGKLVSTPGVGATFYPITHYHHPIVDIGVGTVGAAATMAVYNVYRYVPSDPSKAIIPIPSTLCGTSGRWASVGMRTADTGLAGLDNAHWFGNGFDPLTNDPLPVGYAYKIDLVSGGPVSVYTGGTPYQGWSGGVMMHSVDAKTSGQEFWLHMCPGGTYSVMDFCPSQGMAVNATSGTGATSTYTTDGPDQCIMFLSITAPNNWSFRLLPAGSQGECMAMYHNWAYGEKFFVAPFVNSGVHYDILVPPTVYAGQSFWITVIALFGSGTTKTDYCGTTSFTSTDPAAKIETNPMDSYNYTWTSNIAPCGGIPYNNGVRLFFNVSFTRLGIQTIVASDIYDGSVNGVAAIQVVGADIKFYKEPKLSVAASSDTVRFKICWSNYSSGSGFAMVITDAVPAGTTFVPEASAAGLDCGNTDGVALALSYTTMQSPTMPAAASFTAANPVAGTRWLRWTVPVAGVQTSGCACFRVTVN